MQGRVLGHILTSVGELEDGSKYVMDLEAKEFQRGRVGEGVSVCALVWLLGHRGARGAGLDNDPANTGHRVTLYFPGLIFPGGPVTHRDNVYFPMYPTPRNVGNKRFQIFVHQHKRWSRRRDQGVKMMASGGKSQLMVGCTKRPPTGHCLWALCPWPTCPRQIVQVPQFREGQGHLKPVAAQTGAPGRPGRFIPVS